LQQLEARTRAKGLELKQRLPVYPEFLKNRDALSQLLISRLDAAVDPHGYARSAA
jgi:hypothetical protein